MLQQKLKDFKITNTSSKARLGEYVTSHGIFKTPIFMPVGTQATVKGLNPEQIREVGAEIVLSNTYHLHLRPGDETVKNLGGIQKFMGWNGPILTDSGGYQVFSLAKLRKIKDDGVQFQSHIDGSTVFFTPEKVLDIQSNLGVDIAMILDECLKYPSTFEETKNSLKITTAWAKRASLYPKSENMSVFGIQQGGMYKELRREASESLIEFGFDGYAIGGLSVGEPTEILREMVEFCAPLLPSNRPRYLMGVGTPSDIVASVREGIDMFDCVMPSRSARFGRYFTQKSFINIKNKAHRGSSLPIDENCDCYTCRNFSRGYLSHLFHAGEILSAQLGTIHNLRFYLRLIGDIRAAIAADNYDQFAKNYLDFRDENAKEEVC